VHYSHMKNTITSTRYNTIKLCILTEPNSQKKDPLPTTVVGIASSEPPSETK